MRYNLGLSLLAGLTIGSVLGAIFYVVPAKLLIAGPIPVNGFFLPTGVQDYVLYETLHWGIIPGIIIGFVGGMNTDATAPRGHLSKGIGVWCYMICTTTAWVTQWEYLEFTPVIKIVLTVFVTGVMFLLCLPISQYASFLEAIRERGGSHD